MEQMHCMAVSVARDRQPYVCALVIHQHTPLHTYILSPTDHVRCIYIYIPSFLRAAIHTPVDARASECLYVCARTHSCASAVAQRTNGPRSIEARSSASGTWRAAGRKAAHTEAMVDTDAVFHAPMFALNVDAEENA